MKLIRLIILGLLVLGIAGATVWFLKKNSVQGQTDPIIQQYHSLLQAILENDFALRVEKSPETKLRLENEQNERWNRIAFIRSQIEANSSKLQGDSTEFIKVLIPILVITTLILVLCIYLIWRLYFKVNPAPVVQPQRLRKKPTIDHTQSYLEPTSEPALPKEESTLKKLDTRARERVTKALHGLADALATLKAPTARPHKASSSKPKIQARSLNNEDPTLESVKQFGLQNKKVSFEGEEVTNKITQEYQALHDFFKDDDSNDDLQVKENPLKAESNLEPNTPEESVNIRPETGAYDKLQQEKEKIMRLVRKGMTPSAIAHRMGVEAREIEIIIREQREGGSPL
jgi:flagellar basal body-associated protein FliL